MHSHSDGFNEELREVKHAIQQGDQQEAFGRLKALFRQSRMVEERSAFAEAVGLLVTLIEGAAEALPEPLVEARTRDLEDLEAVCRFAAALYECEIHDVAAALLMWVRTHANSDESVTAAIVDCLEEDARFAEALRVVREDLERFPESFFLHYLLGFHALMCGDIGLARRTLETLSQPPDEQSDSLQRSFAQKLSRVDDLDGVRSLDGHDLQGWQYVISGSLLLHTSAEGAEVMNGRYGFLGDSFSLCRAGLARLQSILSACEIVPTCVQHLPDRGSRILALAAGELLDLPVEPYAAESPDIGENLVAGEGDVVSGDERTEDGGASPEHKSPAHASEAPEPHGLDSVGDDSDGHMTLVIAYDIQDSDEDVLRSLFVRRDKELLFSHITCWTDSFPYTADVTTTLVQAYQSPWDERLRVGADGELETLPPIDESEAALAQQVLDADPEGEDTRDVEHLIRLAKAAGEDAAFRQIGGTRERAWMGPVPSNRLL